jgi:TP901 family phage tail tape measure protein
VDIEQVLLLFEGNAGPALAAIDSIHEKLHGLDERAKEGESGLATNLAKVGAAAALAGVAIAGAAVAVGVESVKAAANFQELTTTLVTGAGESAKNIDMVREGVLKLATETGRMPEALVKGLYLIESAGFHGAEGLHVLETAAKAASVGGADMETTADALTSALNAYHLPASEAAHVTDVLLTTVAQGKMHMQDLAENIGKVLPVAHMAGIGLAELGAAISTMTAQGTDAATATTALRFLLSSLEKPTSAGTTSLKALGMSAEDVNQSLGKRGLAATLEDVTAKINQKFTPGSAEAKRALADIVGGTRGLTAALELTGENMTNFRANIDATSHASQGAGKTMDGWAMVQGTFNLQMDRLQASVRAGAIEIGTRLLPEATRFMRWLVDMRPEIDAFITSFMNRAIPILDQFANWFEANQGTIGAVLGTIGAGLGLVADHLDVIAPLALAVGAAFAVWKVAELAVGIGQMVQGLVGMLPQLVATIGYVWGEVAAFTALAVEEGIVDALMLLNPIGLVIVAIIALIAVVYLLITHWSQIVGVVKAAWAAISNFAGNLGGALEGAWRGIMAGAGRVIDWLKSNWQNILLVVLLGPIGLAIIFIRAHWDQIQAIFSSGVHAVLDFLETTLPRLPFLIGFAIGQSIAHVIGFGKSLWTFATVDVPRWLEQLGVTISQLPGRFKAWLDSTWAGVVAFGARIWAWAQSEPPRWVYAIMSWLEQLPGRSAGEFQKVVASVWAMAGQLATAASKAASDLWNGLVSGLTGLPGRLQSIAWDAVTSFINGAKNAASGLWKAAQDMGSNFVKGFQAGLASGSPSRKMMAAGDDAITGALLGVRKRAPDLLAEAGGIAGSLVAAFSVRPAMAGLTLSGGAGGAGGSAGGPLVGQMVVNHPRSELDLISALQRNEYLRRMQQRGIMPAVGR